ncbi:hypothetical protein NUSPORA_00260 [Nucleospora cyclopteri]
MSVNLKNIFSNDEESVENFIKEAIYNENVTLEFLLDNVDNEEHRKMIEQKYHQIKKEHPTQITSDEEDLTEEEALEKYKSKNIKISKASTLFFGIFKQQLKDINNKKTARISLELSQLLMDIYKASFPKMFRSKSHNLKDNCDLCQKVYLGEISAYDFVRMSADQMKSKDLKEKDNQIIEDSINASKQATPMAESTIFKCSKCNQRKCTYYQLQTRSCDEPMTTFVKCSVCGNAWKF